MTSLLFLLGGLALTTAQQIAHQTREVHPDLPLSVCTKGGDCTSEQTKLVLDANWRWTHQVGTTKNCYTGNEWDKSLCPDGKTCASNCGLDGADYEGTYGITAVDEGIKLGFVTHGAYSSNIGSRSYLLDAGGSAYRMFKLKNREFTFDVDVSQLPCGLNGALYFVSMDADGGMAKYPGNKAGPRYGVGYCDAQCPHDIKFIDGSANCDKWHPSGSDKNAGMGFYGSCCTEMDIWESNSFATAVTPHVCSVSGQYRCNGTECGDDATNERHKGVCDKDGCDFNPFRLGDRDFFGPGSSFAIDSTKKVTVVTQFLTEDGTDDGDLAKIMRLYVQDGKVVATEPVNVGGQTFEGISDSYCTAQKNAFGDVDVFEQKGGLKKLGEDLDAGMVLVMSLWDDHAVRMLWLDSDFPLNKSATAPGVARGSCPTSSGAPADVESKYPDASVTYSKIKVGAINSTFPAPGPSPSPSDCPGGSLAGCIGLCPSNPPAAFQACVKVCTARCARQSIQEALTP